MLKVIPKSPTEFWMLGPKIHPEWELEQIAGGIAFPDLTKKARTVSACVCARRRGGAVAIIGGFTGSLAKMAEEIVNLKDRLHCTRWFYDPRYEETLQPIEETDGFTRYKMRKQQFSTLQAPENLPEHWPYFVSYEHRACLDIALPELLNNFEGAVQQMEAARAQKKLVLAPDMGWDDLGQTISRPFSQKTLVSTPLIATVFAWWEIRDRGDGKPRGSVQDKNIYGNCPRGR